MEFEQKTTFRANGKYWTIVEAREATQSEILDFRLNELMKKDKSDLAMLVLMLEDDKKK